MAKIRLDQALTVRSRLLGRTSGEYKGSIFDKITNGRIRLNDDDLGSVRKKLFSLTPVHVNAGQQIPRGFESEQDLTKRVKADYESYMQHFKNAIDLYEQIILINATQKVDINGKEMTIAFAIVYRDVFLPRKKETLEKLKSAYTQALTQADMIDQAALRQMHEVQMQVAGSDAKGKDVVADKDFEEKYMKTRKAKIYDPLGLKDVIAKMEAEIEKEESDLKTALYTNNIAAEIEWSPSE
jgi:hypothetical protein